MEKGENSGLGSDEKARRYGDAQLQTYWNEFLDQQQELEAEAGAASPAAQRRRFGDDPDENGAAASALQQQLSNRQAESIEKDKSWKETRGTLLPAAGESSSSVAGDEHASSLQQQLSNRQSNNNNNSVVEKDKSWKEARATPVPPLGALEPPAAARSNSSTMLLDHQSSNSTIKKLGSRKESLVHPTSSTSSLQQVTEPVAARTSTSSLNDRSISKIKKMDSSSNHTSNSGSHQAVSLAFISDTEIGYDDDQEPEQLLHQQHDSTTRPRTAFVQPPPPPNDQTPPTPHTAISTTENSSRGSLYRNEVSFLPPVSLEAQISRPGAFAVEGIGVAYSSVDEDVFASMASVEHQSSLPQMTSLASAKSIKLEKPNDEESRGSWRSGGSPTRNRALKIVVALFVAGVLVGVVLIVVMSVSGGDGGSSGDGSGLLEQPQQPTQAPLAAPIQAPTAAPQTPPPVGTAPPTIATSRIENNVHLQADLSIYAVQWGYFFRDCATWQEPIRLDLTCGAPDSDFVDILDARSSNGGTPVTCEKTFQNGVVSCLVSGTPSVADTVILVGCAGRRDRNSNRNMPLIVEAKPATGFSCGRLSTGSAQPDMYVGEVTAGLSVGLFCFPTGAAGAEETLDLRQFGASDCNQATLELTSPTSSTTVHSCSGKGDCSRTGSRCSAAVGDLSVMYNNADDQCFLTDKNENWKFEWDQAAMWSVIDQQLLLPDYASENHLELSTFGQLP